MLTVYTYSNCDNCRKAVKWLKDKKITFIEKPIRESPPTLDELVSMLDFLDGDLRKLFNTSGLDYRAHKIGEKLPSLNEAQALVLLASNGNLVKRPFALSPTLGLVGFKEETWTAALKPK